MAVSNSIQMRREWAMPSADTFDVPVIAAFVKKYLHAASVSIDPFARNKRWATYTNDLNPETAAEYHLEALEFLEVLIARAVRADLIIFDPPYSLEQCARSYKSVGRAVTERDTQIFGRWTDHRHAMSKLLSDDGWVLTFGWNSQGMGRKHGFMLEEMLVVCHGSAHNDTICIAERRVQVRLGYERSEISGQGPKRPTPEVVQV